MTEEIKDVNTALIEIHDELAKREGAQTAGKIPRKLLETEGRVISGLWFWKTNTVHQNLIVWDFERLNSDNSLLLWDRHRTGFLLVEGGLYEVVFGFYGQTQPTVELAVNDEPVISSKKAKDGEKDRGEFRYLPTSENIAGLTCVDYLLLSDRSKLTFMVKGAHKCEGFFKIKKI